VSAEERKHLYTKKSLHCNLCYSLKQIIVSLFPIELILLQQIPQSHTHPFRNDWSVHRLARKETHHLTLHAMCNPAILLATRDIARIKVALRCKAKTCQCHSGMREKNVSWTLKEHVVCCCTNGTWGTAAHTERDGLGCDLRGIPSVHKCSPERGPGATGSSHCGTDGETAFVDLLPPEKVTVITKVD